MKHYTTIEQSKKLVELGLNPDTADMCYIQTPADEYRLTAYNLEYCNNLKQQRGSDMNLIPCWSLAALLDVISNYKLSSEHNCHTCTAETSFGKETVAWFDNPVDACYEMILKLNELNLL